MGNTIYIVLPSYLKSSLVGKNFGNTIQIVLPSHFTSIHSFITTNTFGNTILKIVLPSVFMLESIIKLVIQF